MRHREPFVGDEDPGTGPVAIDAFVKAPTHNGHREPGQNGRPHPAADGRSNGRAHTPPNLRIDPPTATPTHRPATHEPRGPDAGSDAFAQIIDHSPDAICIHQDGRFVFFNAVAVRRLGARSARELLGHAVSRFVHARSVPQVVGRTAALRRPGDASLPLRATMVCVDGAEIHVEVLSVMTTWKGATAYQLILRDLTDVRATQDALAQQAALVENAGDAIIAVTRAGMVTSWNPAAERVYLRPAHRALALPLEIAVGAAIDPASVVRDGGVTHASHYAMDGTVRTMRVSATEYDDGFVLICSDETALRRASRNLRTVINALPEGIFVIDENGWMLTINPAARRILGLDGQPEDFSVHDLPLYDADGALLRPGERPIARAFTTGLPTIGRIMGIDRPDGRRVWLSANCQLLHPDSPDRSPVLVSFTDVTSQRAATEHLAFQAAHDGLTGLPNRAHIMETIDALHRRAGLLRAVLFIDLDDLKTVNDTLGHDVGDTVLQATANRLCSAVRRNDIVGRLAGDEFVALLIGELEDGALERFVGRIRDVLTEPIEIPGGTLHLGASIGVIDTHRDDSRDAATLLRDADAAMYAAKATGRKVSVFSQR
ncbi:diguanylate cyclase [Mycolicibacterium lacusdiani]|uniref:diguanylate cyclase n=1 Tax=Mycolicibacterium lacusdiani TaxID=2895283 RepID=UPI001F021E0A|nr:diguanylate cyclase [Mycolicibacterium lacusdiani]